MAWLIYGTPLDPRMDPQFGWTGDSHAVVKELIAKRAEGVVLHEVPRLTLQKAQHSRRQSSPPDLFRSASIWVVSEVFRLIVGEVEPGKNQFFPVTLLDKTGSELPLRYHLMNVTQRDDTLNLEKSDVHSSWLEGRTPSGEGTRFRQWHLDPHPEKLVAERARIGAKHLWRGEQFFWLYLFFSDELMKRTKKKKLRGLIAYRVIEE